MTRPLLRDIKARRLFLGRHLLLRSESGPGSGENLAGVLTDLEFVQVDSVNTLAVIGGCLVSPGDLVIGDDDGLVSLAPSVVRARVADAEAKLARATGWISALAAGETATEVFGLAPAVRA